MTQVVVSDRIRLPAKLIPRKVIEERYDVELFNDDKCKKCENFQDRSPTNELCKGCAAFGGAYRFFSTAEYKENKVWSLPQADEFAVRRVLDKLGRDYDWKDERPVHPMKHKIKFTGTLYRNGDVDDNGNERPDQVSAIKQWTKKKVGVIQAAPRCGKTVMSTAIYCQERVRTVVIANKRALLNQFYETACGVPAPRYLRGKMVPSPHPAGRQAVTNIPDLQERTGKQIIFMPSSYKNLRDFMKKTKEIPDVLLLTEQSYAKDPRRVARIINKYYSLAVIDEQHGAGADAYLAFVASLNVKYRCGLSATPDRKDNRSALTRLVFGPVVATIYATALRPSIIFRHSPAVPSYTHKQWTGAFQWLIKSKKRNVDIVRHVFKDLREGHNAIVIPVDYKAHMKLLVKMINAQARNNNEKRDENWPENLAREYHGGMTDDQQLKTLVWVDTVEKGERVHRDLPTRSPRVLVAIRSMVKEGLDMKRPSAMYAVLPMSAKGDVGAPMARQMFTRVATPFADKPNPIVRYWVDSIGMMASCATGLLYHEILPRSTLNKQNKHPQYTLTRENYEKAKTIINLCRSHGAEPAKKSNAKGFW